MSTLINYISRYRKDKELIAKYPEQADLLEKRINQHKEDIVSYVTDDQFLAALEHLNL